MSENRQKWIDAAARHAEFQKERLKDHKERMKKARENYEKTFRKGK